MNKGKYIRPDTEQVQNLLLYLINVSEGTIENTTDEDWVV